MAEWISEYYNMGLYTKDDVRIFVDEGWIMEDDYKNITGEDY